MRLGLGLGLNSNVGGGNAGTVIAMAGQSNATRWYSQMTDAPTNLTGGLEVSYPELAPVSLVDSAEAGSGVLKSVDASKYWIDDDSAPSYAKGTSYTNFVSALSGATPTAILVINGEDDADAIAAATITEADFKAGLQALIDFFVADYPNVKIFIQPLGKRANTTNAAGWCAVRRAQWEVYSENAEVFWLEEHYDLALVDTVHYADASYETIATRMVTPMGEVLTTGASTHYPWDWSGVLTFNSAIFADIDSGTWTAMAGENFTATAGQEPTFTATDNGGLGAITAPDTSTKLLSGTFSATGAINMGAIMDYGANTTAARWFGLGSSTNTTLQCNTSNRQIFYRLDISTDNAQLYLAGGDTGLHLHMIEAADASDITVYHDNVTHGVPEMRNRNPNDDWVSGTAVHLFSYNGADSRADMGITGVWAFNRVLTSAEKTAIGQYFARQNGLTLSTSQEAAPNTAFTNMASVEASAEFDCDFRISSSYGGTGDTVSNIVASPASGASQTDYDFVRQEGSPTFTGTAGKADAYMELDGATTYQIGTNPTHINNLVKTTGGTDFWFACSVFLPSGSRNFGLFGTQSSVTSIGFRIQGTSSETLRLLQRADSTNTFDNTNANEFTPGEKAIIIVSYDHGTSTWRVWVNSETATYSNTLTLGTETDNPSAPLYFGVLTYPTTRDYIANGGRLYAKSGGNAFLDDTKAGAIYREYVKRGLL